MERDRSHAPGGRRAARLLVCAALFAAACGGGAPAAPGSSSSNPAAGQVSGSSGAAKPPSPAATAKPPATSGGSTATLDACAVAGPADIRKALGQAPSNSPKQEDLFGQQFNCGWKLANGVDLNVLIMVLPVEYRNQPVNTAVLLPSLPGYQYQPAAGLGRAARVGEDAKAAGGLTASREVDVVLKDHRLTVSAVGSSLGSLPSASALVALARTIAGRVS